MTEDNCIERDPCEVCCGKGVVVNPIGIQFKCLSCWGTGKILFPTLNDNNEDNSDQEDTENNHD